jgi:hypothetical protein
MTRHLRSCIAIVAILLAALHASIARAVVDVRPLDTLLAGGANEGDVADGNWRYHDFTFRSTGAIPVDPAQVTVVLDGELSRSSLGFRWQTEVPASLGGAEAAFDVGYVLEGSFPWGVSAGLCFNGSVPSQGPGNATATVRDTLTLPDGRTLTLDVFNDGPGRVPDDNSDFSSWDVTSTARRKSHVSLVSWPGGGPMTLSFVHNLVEPLPDFPEPSVLALAAPLAPVLLRRPTHARRPIN